MTLSFNPGPRPNWSPRGELTLRVLRNARRAKAHATGSPTPAPPSQAGAGVRNRPPASAGVPPLGGERGGAGWVQRTGAQ